MSLINKLLGRKKEEQESDNEIHKEQQLDLNTQYLVNIGKQQNIRIQAVKQMNSGQSHNLGMNIQGIRSVVANRSEYFDGHLILAAANDFGQIAGFAPQNVDVELAFDYLLQDLRNKKWEPVDMELRNVWKDIESGLGVHKALPAIYYPDSSIDKMITYDISPPAAQDYTYVTLREATGLVDWVANMNARDDAIVRY